MTCFRYIIYICLILFIKVLNADIIHPFFLALDDRTNRDGLICLIVDDVIIVPPILSTF